MANTTRLRLNTEIPKLTEVFNSMDKASINFAKIICLRMITAMDKSFLEHAKIHIVKTFLEISLFLGNGKQFGWNNMQHYNSHMAFEYGRKFTPTANKTAMLAAAKKSNINFDQILDEILEERNTSLMTGLGKMLFDHDGNLENPVTWFRTTADKA